MMLMLGAEHQNRPRLGHMIFPKVGCEKVRYKLTDRWMLVG